MKDINRYASDKERSQNTARIQIQFISQNKKHLSKLRNSKKLIAAVEDFEAISKKNGSFTPNQMSYIDAIYEKVFKGAGFESVPTKHDLKRKLS